MRTDMTLRRNRVLRDELRTSEKIQIGIIESGPFFMIILGGAVLFFPVVFEACILVYLLIWRIFGTAPFPEEKHDRRLRKHTSNAALYCMGMEVNIKKPVWFTDTQMRQHMLVMGTTGAGKTEFLLWLSAQAMAQGSGVIFVDGKGDVKTWFRLYSIARRIGCEESIRVLNFGTNLTEGESKYTLSNTLNPFTLGDASQLTEMMSALMAEGGGDNAMWKERAVSMIRALITCLVDLREMGEIEMGPNVLADYMPLDKLGKFETDERLSELGRLEVKRYLDSLPGFRAGGQQGKAESDKQHGFLTMQFTALLGLLNNAYGHIMKFRLGEIDMLDVIINRRSLYVMLPSMEKSPESTKNLGKIVVQQIRAALSKTLGAGVRGSKAEKLDARPTNSITPMLCILDEYGSYAVEGFGEVAAQARSIGFSTCFAVQDWASLEKADQRGNEAQRIWANTNIKIIMKVEDSKSTMPLVQDRIKKGYVLESSGKETNRESLTGGERKQATSRYAEVDRLDPQRLFELKNGRFIVICGSKFHEVQAPFLDPNKGAWRDVDFIEPSRLVPISPPSTSQITENIATHRKLMSSISMDEDQVDTSAVDDVDRIREFSYNLVKTIDECEIYRDDPGRYGLAFFKLYIKNFLHTADNVVNDSLNGGQRDEATRDRDRDRERNRARQMAGRHPDGHPEAPEDMRSAHPSSRRDPREDLPNQMSESIQAGIYDEEVLDGDDMGHIDYPEPQNKEMNPLKKPEYVSGAMEIANLDPHSRLGRVIDKSLSSGLMDDDESGDDDGDEGGDIPEIEDETFTDGEGED